MDDCFSSGASVWRVPAQTLARRAKRQPLSLSRGRCEPSVTTVVLRRHLCARPTVAGVHVLDPLEPEPVLQRGAKFPGLRGAIVRAKLDVGELGRYDDRREDRGRRQVRHGERVADQIAAWAGLRLDLLESVPDDLARVRDAVRPDLVAPLHDGREHRTQRLEQTDSRIVGAVEQPEKLLRLREVVIEQDAAQVVPAALVEVLLELERPAPFLRIGGVEGWFRPLSLDLLDDPGRVADRASVQLQDRRGATCSQPARPEFLQRGRHGATHVTNPLVVERPTRLLVVVRDLEVPKDRRYRRHGSILTPGTSSADQWGPAGTRFPPTCSSISSPNGCRGGGLGSFPKPRTSVDSCGRDSDFSAQ